MQLLTHPDVDLRPPSWRLLAWLTKTAVREAWDLARPTARRAHEHQLEHVIIERDKPPEQRGDRRAARRLALDLVAQIPERPRRFLLRQALGYSYDEIAALSRAAVVVVGSALGTLVGDMSSTASAAR